MEQQQVAVLQEFRNRILLASPEGRRYVVLYYVHAPELMRILRGNDALRTDAGEFLQVATPHAAASLADGHAVIAHELLAAGIAVCDLIASQAGERLRASIESLKHDIVQGDLLARLGIEVNGTDQ